ncbi:Myc-type, basic helix-loop-helix [Sesbania bispinosa]|nr:Myc-type, basic helix-loop-helix [Sesbania bispinosa]
MHQQPATAAFSSDSESLSPTTNNLIFTSSQHNKLPAAPTSYILSFGDSTVVTATRHGGKQPLHDAPSKHENHFQQPIRPPNQTVTKKSRSSTETLDHIMAERKRRRELTERFIALSATIPGLKKIDKSTILGEAISHVKRLQERVRELEEQSKKTSVESVSFIRKSYLTGTGAILNKSDDDDCYRSNEALPTVEARVFKKDILLRIHCKIQNGILLKILDHLKNLHLSTISNSVMPFGNSTLDISIIAQMGDKFNVTMDDLVKNLRLALLESSEELQ